MLAVLAVIAILGGASFLGGGLALAGMLTGSAASGDEPEPEAGDEPAAEESPSPTPTPTPERTPLEEPSPTEEPPEPEELMTASELVDELRTDYSISSRLDTTDEFCEGDPENEFDFFQCSSAMDTDVVRVVAFDNPGAALMAALAMQSENAEGDAEDAQDACHFVLVWFPGSGLDQGERDGMAEDARDIVDC